MRRRPSALLVSMLLSSVPVRAAPTGSGESELAQSRPRPVQKGRRPVKPGETPPPAAEPSAGASPDAEPRDLERIREEARRGLTEAADAGDAPLAARSVQALLPFVQLEDAVEAKVRAALVHVEEGDLGRAERALDEARATAPQAELLGLAHRAVSGARGRAEQKALADIVDAADPRPAAKVLANGLVVTPDSSRATGAADRLARKVERRNATLSDEQVAQAVEALAILENAPGDTVARLTEAAEALGAGRLADAEASFRDIQRSAVGPEASDVAELAAGWVGACRVRALEDALEAAGRADDVLEESRVVQALLSLDSDHREANRRARTIERRVVAARLEMVEARREANELGVAYWFIARGLEVDPDHPELRRAQAEIEEELGRRTELILVVEAVTMKAEGCGAFAPVLQKEAMEVVSRREDLGGYVLSEGWTRAWREGDARAPTVTGSLTMTVTDCQVTPASGSARVRWAVRTPRGVDGTPVAEGEVDARIGAAAIPKEEQDSAGGTARRVLADEVATLVADRIAEARDAMEAWLLTLAGHHLAGARPVDTADAWARFELDRPTFFDEELASTVEAYLSKAYP